jgi:MFS family permease
MPEIHVTKNPDALEMEDYGETTVSKRSLRGMDVLNFFLADVRDGIGPYLGIYLLAKNWDQASIGWAMSAAGIAGVVAQTPGGWVVDRLRQKRWLVIISIIAIALSCLAMAFWAVKPVIYAAQIITGTSAAIIGPAVAAITLGLVGRKKLSRRVGRNESIGHGGNVFAALAAGLLGYYLSNDYIFYLVAVMSIFSVASVLWIREEDIDHDLARGATEEKSEHDDANISGIGAVLADRHVWIFAIAVILFHFANAAMLMLVVEQLTEKSEKTAALFTSACIITAQLVMIPVTAYTGKFLSAWGRKPVFLIAFIALPIRALLYTVSDNSYFLVSVQILDGIAGGIFGVATLVMIADLTSGTGRFNLTQGAIGTATGIGASLSTIIAGYIVKAHGYNAGFFFLMSIAIIALAVFWFFVTETKNLHKREKKEKSKDGELFPAV